MIGCPCACARVSIDPTPRTALHAASSWRRSRGGRGGEWTILGGPGTPLGPVLAAVLMSPGIDWLRSLMHQYVFAVGAITLLVVLLAPDGVGAVLGRGRRRPGAPQEAHS